MKSLFVSSFIILASSLSLAATTQISNPTYKCTGYGDGGGGVVVSIQGQKARAWFVDYSTDVQGKELENTSLEIYRCPGCFTVKGKDANNGSYTIKLNGNFAADGIKVKMTLSLEGTELISDIPCTAVKSN